MMELHPFKVMYHMGGSVRSVTAEAVSNQSGG